MGYSVLPAEDAFWRQPGYTGLALFPGASSAAQPAWVGSYRSYEYTPGTGLDHTCDAFALTSEIVLPASAAGHDIRLRWRAHVPVDSEAGPSGDCGERGPTWQISEPQIHHSPE